MENNNEGFLALTKVQTCEEFFNELIVLKDQHGAKTLAKMIGVEYATFYAMLGNKKASLLTLVRMSTKLADVTSVPEDDLMGRLCLLFDKKKPDVDEMLKLKEKITTAKERKESFCRPGYYASALFLGSVRVEYSVEEELRDIEQIRVARDNPENGLENALTKLWWMQQTGQDQEIGFTLEEAITLEANFRLCEFKTSDNFSCLLYNLVKIDEAFLPKYLTSEEKIKYCRFVRPWVHPQERLVIITPAEKLEALKMTADDMQNLLRDQSARVGRILTEKIMRTYETERCDDEYKQLQEAARCNPNIWLAIGVSPAELYSLVEKSMLYEVKRLALEQVSRSPGGRYDVKEVLDIIEAWGFSFEMIGITPKFIASILLNLACTSMRERLPDFFKNKAVNAEIQSFFLEHN